LLLLSLQHNRFSAPVVGCRRKLGQFEVSAIGLGLLTGALNGNSQFDSAVYTDYRFSNPPFTIAVPAGTPAAHSIMAYDLSLCRDQKTFQ
jgi:hypothetical protein